MTAVGSVTDRHRSRDYPPDGASVERRQLWARDTVHPTAALVYIRPGDAPDVRDACRAGRLACPFPGCADPRLTTAGGPHRRDHFRHRSGGGHEPESWRHYTAKHLVGAWLRERYPDFEVTVDEATIETGQRPDVLMVRPDGSRVALEVQYAALTLEAWQDRHAGYARSGVADVWLWGWGSRWLGATSAELPLYRLPGPLATVMAHGVSLRWIDPDERVILSPRYDGAAALPASLDVYRDDIRLCRLAESGLWAPSDRQEAVERERRQQERAAEQARAAAERARLERWRAEREERAVERDRQRVIRQGERENRQIGAWNAYRAKNAQRLRHAPWVVTDVLPTDHGLDLLPQHFHALVFARFLNGRLGETFDVGDVIETFCPHGRLADVEAAVTTYLRSLARTEYVAPDPADGWDGPVRVLADADHHSRWEFQFGMTKAAPSVEQPKVPERQLPLFDKS